MNMLKSTQMDTTGHLGHLLPVKQEDEAIENQQMAVGFHSCQFLVLDLNFHSHPMCLGAVQ